MRRPRGAWSSSIQAVFLGTGTSAGVPILGCNCAVCTSPDPRNRRLRSALWLRDEHTSLLLDCGPDFRQQALRAGLRQVDAVILSHEHYDHIFGLDDLRFLPLPDAAGLPIWGNAATLACVRQAFAYVFSDHDSGSFVPRLTLHLADAGATTLEVAGVRFVPLPVEHAGLEVLGLRLGDLAWLPDCKHVPPSTMERLQGLDTLIVDGLRRQPHRTHFGLDEALALVAALAPRQTWLTHLTHDYDHGPDDQALPPGVNLAYDGLVVEVTGMANSSSAS